MSELRSFGGANTDAMLGEHLKLLEVIREKVSSIGSDRIGARANRWAERKKLIDANLHFVRIGKDGEMRFNSRKTNEYRASPELERAVRDGVPSEVVAAIALDPDPENLYVSFFQGAGLPGKRSVAYVGKVTKRSTGAHRKVMERWGYSGHDHGADARRIFKHQMSRGSTAVDRCLADYDFGAARAFVFVTSGDERKCVLAIRKIARELGTFDVVNATFKGCKECKKKV